MLKRKRSDGRPPSKGGNSHNHSSAAKPPPAAAPQPEKAVGAFEANYADVLRALKKARGFERQRLAKRITEEKKQSKANGKKKPKAKGKAKKAADISDPTGDPTEDQSADRMQRLEREVEVLKTLDYEVAARVHLANAMLRTRGVAEAPGPLGAHLQLASEVLSQRTKAYRTDDIHNVTSALYNRPFVRDTVTKATRGMCQLLGLPPPDKNAPRVRKRGKEEAVGDGEGDDKEAVDDETRRNTQANTPMDKTLARKSEEDDEDDEEGKDDDDDDAEGDNIEYNEADDEAIERELAKYDSMLGGDSGDEDDDVDGSLDGDSDDDSDDDSDEGLDDDAVVAKLRAKYAAAVAKGLWKDDDRDDFSGEDSDGGDDDEEEDFAGFSSSSNSGESDEDDDEEDEDDDEEDDGDSESDEDLRPRKRNATASASVGGTSHFLPSLMGGYISDGGDSDGDRGSVADDEEAAARMLSGPRKNRRGQRARQAIWEKKYKQLAKHVLEEEKQGKDGSSNGKENKASSKNGKQKDGGWDAKRGAVDANDKPRWLRRKMGLLGRVGPVGGGGSGAAGSKPSGGDGNSKKDNPNANAQVSGTLHPSWEAARKAKDKAQTAAFEGKKIVFD